MSDQDARVPDLLLERYRLGEMSGEQRRGVGATARGEIPRGKRA